MALLADRSLDRDSGQFEDRGQSMEAIYNSSDQDYDSGDEKTQRRWLWKVRPRLFWWDLFSFSPVWLKCVFRWFNEAIKPLLVQFFFCLVRKIGVQTRSILRNFCLTLFLSVCLSDDRGCRRGEGVSCSTGGSVRTFPRGFSPQIPAVAVLRPEHCVHRGRLPPDRAPRHVPLPSALTGHKIQDKNVSAGRSRSRISSRWEQQ